MSTPPPPPPWAWWHEAARRSPSNPDLRVSDAERAAVGDVLSKHYADGRLDDNEFKERIDRAMSAKTRSDLMGLTTDLPRFDVSAPPPVRQHRGMHLLGIVFVSLFAVSVISSIFAGPWFGFHRVPWIVVLVVGVLLWRRLSWRRLHRHHDHSHSTASPFS